MVLFRLTILGFVRSCFLSLIGLRGCWPPNFRGRQMLFLKRPPVVTLYFSFFCVIQNLPLRKSGLSFPRPKKAGALEKRRGDVLQVQSKRPFEKRRMSHCSEIYILSKNSFKVKCFKRHIMSEGKVSKGKCPKRKCPKGKCPKGKCPKGKCSKGKCR